MIEQIALSRLDALSFEDDFEFRDEDDVVVWRGDLFERENPLWRQMGVLQPTKAGGLAVSNTRQTRATVAALLERLVGLSDQ